LRGEGQTTGLFSDHCISREGEEVRKQMQTIEIPLVQQPYNNLQVKAGSGLLNIYYIYHLRAWDNKAISALEKKM
jgi:hypothetical protein